MNFKPSLLTFSILAGSVHCFSTGSIKQSKKVIFQQRLETKISAHDKTEQLCNDDNDVSFVEFNKARRSLICNIGATMVGGIVSFANNDPAFALVEGYAPPPKNKGKALPEEYRQGTAALADSDDNAVVPADAYVKLSSGVTYADLRVGNGDEAVVGKKVNLQWVLRRSDGYYVEASKDNDSVPFIFTVGDSQAAIAGMNEGVQGMKVGGVRRLLIPPSLAYVEGLENDKVSAETLIGTII